MSSFLNWLFGINKEKTPNELYKEITELKMYNDCLYIGECSQREVKVHVVSPDPSNLNIESNLSFYPPLILCHAEGGENACQRHQDSKKEKLRELAKEYHSKVDDSSISPLGLDIGELELEI